MLAELRNSEFIQAGKPTNLLHNFQLISGVSGGSILAPYYVAFGDEVFSRFEKDLLLVNQQSALVKHALSPGNLHRLTSPWFGRSNLLEESLNVVYRGKTFGDLAADGTKPRLLVTATDLSTGVPFEFTSEQFGLICSDLRTVPLSFAVAASSAVPLLLTPLTVRNYAGTCPQTTEIAERLPAGSSPEAEMRREGIQSYLDSKARPYLHLVDGGVTDNLGVRALMDRALARGTFNQTMVGLRFSPGSLQKMVVVSVNSERDVTEHIDLSERVPTTSQVLDALTSGAGARGTQQTVAIMKDSTERWVREISESRGKSGSPFAADAELYVIHVTLKDVARSKGLNSLLQVPTSFAIAPEQVRELQLAGRQALRASPDFQRLLRSLNRTVETPWVSRLGAAQAV